MKEPPLRDSYNDYEVKKTSDGAPMILGRGSFGVTLWGTRSRKIGEITISDDFAIKVLHAHFTSDSSRVKAFIEEILALRSLQHPNLASYVETDTAKTGEIFLVMELCKGGDLHQIVRKTGKLDESVAIAIGIQICEGLDEAHRKNYIHRDLKPSNVLLAESLSKSNPGEALAAGVAQGSYQFKIVDFGLADKLADDGKGPLRRLAGTPMFMSPEQVRERPLEAASDLYSLGMTLWYLVQGNGPFLDSSGKELKVEKEVMKRHTSSEPHDRSFPSSITPEFRNVLSRLVEKDKKKRISSVREAISMLEALRSERPVEVNYSGGASGSSTATQASVISSQGGIPDQWGSGRMEDFFSVDISNKLRSRPIGQTFEARATATDQRVSLTVWETVRDIQSEEERKLGNYLINLARLTTGALAPDNLIQITQVERTRQEWCVAEEWTDGIPLSKFLNLRGRSISLDEASQILHPIAKSCGYLQAQGIQSAMLTVEEVLIVPKRASQLSNLSWLNDPVEDWVDWTPKFSVMALPEEFRDDDAEDEFGSIGGTVSDSFGWGASDLDLKKSYCRLLFRLVDGTEVPLAADWDENSYVTTPKLSSGSNELMRESISSDSTSASIVEILNSICTKEGIFRYAATATRDASVYNTGSLSSRYDTTTKGGSTGGSRPETGGGSSGPASVPGSFQAPGSMVRSYDSELSPALSSVSEREVIMESKARASSFVTHSQVNDDYDASIPLARFISTRPGWVTSEFSSNPQKVPGSQWKPWARIKCEETGNMFMLPGNPQPLLATIIEGRFDAVLSPYCDTPTEIPVPEKNWVPGNMITCRFTGEPIQLGDDLPLPEGQPVAEFPGNVLSPWGENAEFRIEPDNWNPGERFKCIETGLFFVLPDNLPELEAVCESKTGWFRSPFDFQAESSLFELEPKHCRPKELIDCPNRVGKKIRLPRSFPRDWKFEALDVRVLETPEARSPFSEEWQTTNPARWNESEPVRCEVTGQEFFLPERLPPLVAGAEAGNEGRVKSPYPPHDWIDVSPDEWKAGGVLTVPLAGGNTRKIILPDRLPNWVPMGVVVEPGKAKGPYLNSMPFDIPPSEWKSGQELQCPDANRPFKLPPLLPLLPAIIVKEGVVKSPVTGKTINIDPIDWEGGFVVTEGDNQFELPESVPDWIVDGTLIDCRPGWMYSPYRDDIEIRVTPDQWKGGGQMTCPFSAKQVGVPLPKNWPSLDIESAVVDFSLDEPAANAETVAAKVGENGDISGAKPSAATVKKIWKRHKIETEKSRQAACPECRVDSSQECGTGVVRSPFGGMKKIEIPGPLWRPGSRHQCPETEKGFRLPQNLPPLVGKVHSAGKVLSPYLDDPDPIDVVPPDLWHDKNPEVTCDVTRMVFIIPSDRPEWIPECELVDGSPGLVISPFGKRDKQEVDGKLWEGGGRVRCDKTQNSFKLPGKLPPLKGSVVSGKTGVILSPYSEREMPVDIDDWAAGATVKCEKTGRDFELPDSLPEWIPAATDPKTQKTIGLVKSPYGDNEEIHVPGHDWEPGKALNCNSTGRKFRLPNDLPPLEAKSTGTLGTVLSPYVSKESKIEVPVQDWEAGAEVTCPETDRVCVLPGDIPVWEAKAEATKTPGTITNPYRPGETVKVTPIEWIEGGRVRCPETGRGIKLPESLPLLEAEIQKPGLILSPFAADDPIQLEHHQWRIGVVLKCKVTGREFTLPGELPEWLPEVEVIDGVPGTVKSIFGRRRRFEIPGADWEPGRKILCPETDRPMQLPEKLAPMIATIESGDEPGKAYSPYCADGRKVAVQVPRRNWKPGNLIQCSETGRLFALPQDITVMARSKWPLIAGGIAALVAVVFGIGFLLPDKEPDDNGGDDPEIVKVPEVDVTPVVPDDDVPEVKEVVPIVKKVEPKDEPPKVVMKWPESIEFSRSNVKPTEVRALIFKDKEYGDPIEGVWPLERSGGDLVLKVPASQLNDAKRLFVRLTQDGYKDSAPIEISKTKGGGPYVLGDSEVTLERHSATLIIPGIRQSRFYESLKLTMIESAAGAEYVRIDEMELPLSIDLASKEVLPLNSTREWGVKKELPTGTYKLEWIGRDDIPVPPSVESQSSSKTIIVENRVGEAMPFKAGATETVQVPNPLPEILVGDISYSESQKHYYDFNEDPIEALPTVRDFDQKYNRFWVIEFSDRFGGLAHIENYNAINMAFLGHILNFFYTELLNTSQPATQAEKLWITQEVNKFFSDSKASLYPQVAQGLAGRRSIAQSFGRIWQEFPEERRLAFTDYLVKKIGNKPDWGNHWAGFENLCSPRFEHFVGQSIDSDMVNLSLLRTLSVPLAEIRGNQFIPFVAFEFWISEIKSDGTIVVNLETIFDKNLDPITLSPISGQSAFQLLSKEHGNSSGKVMLKSASSN